MRDSADVDFRAYNYAATLGLEQGWSRLYDQGAFSDLIHKHLTGVDAIVNSSHTYPNPPLLAWMLAPAALLPYDAAYVVWTAIGVAALVCAWWLVCPYSGLSRLTLLLVALAIWPIHYALVLGQPTPEILLLTAAAWWFLRRDQPVTAGIVLAVATALKPQDVILVPIALLLARRPRVFVAWATGCAVLALLFVASLGATGLSQFWSTTVEVESDPFVPWRRPLAPLSA